MAYIILVHGMAANEKSWFDVPEFLTKEGHTVVPVGLPGHDRPFSTPEDSAIAMADYVKEVADKFPPDGTLVALVGHSMGGQVITEVAARHAEKIDRLIYIAAMLPQDGQSAQDIIGGSGIDPAKFMRRLLVNVELRPEAFASQPEAPLREKFKVPRASDGSVLKAFADLRRFYIWCTKDEVLPSAHQKIMADAAGIDPSRIEIIDTGHIPQATQPAKLHAALKKFIEAV